MLNNILICHLLLIEPHGEGYKAGRFLRSSDLGIKTEHAEWKHVVYDQNSKQLVVPNGTMGQRYEKDVKWNLKLENEDGTVIDPALTFKDADASIMTIQFPYFDNEGNGILKPILVRN